MNEQLPTHSLENLPSPEVEDRLPEGEEPKLIEVGNEHLLQAEQLEAARGSIEQTATAIKDNKALEQLKTAQESDDTLPNEQAALGEELKQIVKNRELKHLQRRETRSQRTLSRFIHQPVVRVISDSAAKTISRPSGLLGGGIIALVGSAGYYYLTRRIGLKYNYSLFLLLFIGGFILGLIMELLAYAISSKRKRLN